MPHCAAMAVLSPISTLWAICTRLSSFTSLWMCVEPMVERSIVVLAPISTLSSTYTLPICGNLLQLPSFSGTNPNPSAPSTQPECRMQFAPTTQLSYILTPAYSVVSLPIFVWCPMNVCGYILAPSAISAPLPIYANSPMYTSLPIFAVSDTNASGDMPAAGLGMFAATRLSSSESALYESSTLMSVALTAFSGSKLLFTSTLLAFVSYMY